MVGTVAGRNLGLDLLRKGVREPPLSLEPPTGSEFGPSPAVAHGEKHFSNVEVEIFEEAYRGVPAGDLGILLQFACHFPAQAERFVKRQEQWVQNRVNEDSLRRIFDSDVVAFLYGEVMCEAGALSEDRPEVDNAASCAHLLGKPPRPPRALPVEREELVKHLSFPSGGVLKFEGGGCGVSTDRDQAVAFERAYYSAPEQRVEVCEHLR